MLLTLGFLLSTVISPMASGIVAVGFFGATWTAGVWPPDRAPLVIAVMSNRLDPDAEHDDALIARAASAAFAALE